MQKYYRISIRKVTFKDIVIDKEIQNHIWCISHQMSTLQKRKTNAEITAEFFSNLSKSEIRNIHALYQQSDYCVIKTVNCTVSIFLFIKKTNCLQLKSFHVKENENRFLFFYCIFHHIVFSVLFFCKKNKQTVSL